MGPPEARRVRRSLLRRSTLRTARKRHWLSPVPLPRLCSAARQKKPAPFPVRRQSRQTFHIRSLLLPFPSAAHFIGPADGFLSADGFVSALLAVGPMRCTSGLRPHGVPRGSQSPWPTVERDSQGKTHTEGFSLAPRFFPPFLCAETKKWGRRRHVGANCVSFAPPRAAGLTHSVAPPLRVRSFDRTRFFIPHGTKAALAVSFRRFPRRSKNQTRSLRIYRPERGGRAGRASCAGARSSPMLSFSHLT